MYRVRTTDEMDHITPEERKSLMGYCERDEEWWKFTAEEGVKPKCPICGDKPSNAVGFQIMTQRTFNPQLHGKKKAKKRR